MDFLNNTERKAQKSRDSFKKLSIQRHRLALPTATMTARDDAVAAKRRATDEAERHAFFASADEEAEEARPPSANTDNAPKGKGAKKMTPDVKSSPGA